MFYDCYSITSLDLSTFNTSSVIDMSYMLFGCFSLISLNLTNFDTSSVTNMRYMFNLYSSEILDKLLDQSYLIEMPLENITEMIDKSYFFNSLDLSNFNTTSVNDMSNMFAGLISLKSLNLMKFDTSSVTNMNYMFYECILLTSLNLTSFRTFNVQSMNAMFAFCLSLISLDLSNFFTPLIDEFKAMFLCCKSLEYLNLKNFALGVNDFDFEKIFSFTSDYLVYCINSQINYNDHPIKIQLLSLKCSTFDCSSDWKSKRKKTIINTDTCLDSCSSFEYYEYNNYCYPKCPNGTQPSLNNEYLCENISKIINNNSFQGKNETIWYNDKFEIFLVREKINLDLKIYQDSIKNIIHKINNGEFNSLILNIINRTKDDFIVQDNNITFQITSLYNQNNNNYNNLSSIYIDKECENLLKSKFNIDMNETLILFKYDYYIPGLKIPIIGFEIYNPITKEPLDLKHCSNIKNYNIKLNIPVKINEDEIYK